MRGVVVLCLAWALGGCAAMNQWAVDNKLMAMSDPCPSSEAFQKEWAEHSQQHTDYCAYAEASTEGPIKGWVGRSEGWTKEGVAGRWAAFADQHGACFDNYVAYIRSKGSGSSEAGYENGRRYAAECKEAGPIYAAALSGAVESFLEHNHTNTMEAVSAAQDDRDWVHMEVAAGRGIREVKAIAEAVPDHEGLSDALSALEDKQAVAKEKLVATMKKRRCPSKDDNPQLSGKLKPLFQDYLDANTALDNEAAKTFRVEGDTYQEVDWKKTLYEYADAWSCVEQTKGDDLTCRVFSVTMVRVRPDGASWGGWGYQSIGGGAEMRCRKVK